MLGLCFLDKARAYAFAVYYAPSAVEARVVNPLPLPVFIPGEYVDSKAPVYDFYMGEQGLGYYLRRWFGKHERGWTPGIMVRLVMHHDVDGEHVARGFEKTLRPRIVAQMQKRNKEEGELEQLQRLKMTFERFGAIPKGTKFDFFRDEGGILTLACEGQVVDTFEAPLMGWALVDAFLGEKGHLNGKGREELAQSAALLKEIRPLSEFSVTK